MKKLRFLGILFTLVSLLAVQAPALAAEMPEISASAALLMEPESGTVLYSRNASGKMAPASLTKLMTALLTVEAYENGTIDIEDTFTVQNSIFFDVEAKSSLKFKDGEEIKLYDVLACALIASVNEACNMLAEAVAGDTSAFVDMMNERASELGCTGTHFENAHGLPNDNHYSTAEDMYRIFSAVMAHSELTDIMRKTEYSFPGSEEGEVRKIATTDRLINKDSVYYYEFAMFGKTGSTSKAGYCLASCAEKDDVRLISVVLGCEGVENKDGSTTMTSFTDTRKLFRWGYDSFGMREIINTSDLVCEIPVELGDGAKSVVLRPANAVSVYMNLSVPEEDIERHTELFSESLRAPVEAGEIYGRLSLEYGGRTLGTVELVTNTAVPLMHLEFIRAEIRAFFGNILVKLAIAVIVIIIILYAVYVITVNRRRREEYERQKIEEARAAERIEKSSFEDTEKRR